MVVWDCKCGGSKMHISSSQIVKICRFLRAPKRQAASDPMTAIERANLTMELIGLPLSDNRRRLNCRGVGQTVQKRQEIMLSLLKKRVA